MNGRTALYRILGDADLLLYIGISKNFGRRWSEEAKAFQWWDEHRRMTIEWYDSRPDAKAAERDAIRAEHPKHNQQHNRPVRPKQARPPRDPRLLGLTRGERLAMTRITRTRAENPAYARSVESRTCSSCGAKPGDLCRSRNDRLAWYHVGRFDRMMSPASG